MRVEPDGPVPSKLAIFGQNPGYEETIEGRGFVGKSGQQLWSDMRRICGLERKDFYVSNIIKESTPKNRPPKPAEISAALPEVLEELERVRPRIVVAAGGFAIRFFVDLPVHEVHGIPFKVCVAAEDYTVLPIYHPAAGLHAKGALAAFDYDLRKLKELLDGTGTTASGRDLRVRDVTPDHLAGRSEWLVSPPTGGTSRRRRGQSQPRSPLDVARGGVVAIDTEGWASSPWGLSFCFDGERGYVVRAGNQETLAWFARWIKDKTVVGHNIIHDIPVLRAMGVEQWAAMHDTQVLAYHDMLRTGSGILEAESQNLGTLAFRELNVRLGELKGIPGVDFETRYIPSSEAVMDYAGADPIATYRLFRVYEDRGLVRDNCYQIDMGQVRLVEEMIVSGIPFDEESTMDFYVDVLEKLETVKEELRAMATKWGNRDFNPGSHPQVRDIVTKRLGLRVRKRTKGGLASTNEKALAEHKDHPFVAKMQLYRELAKLKGTYLEPLLEELQ